LGANIELLKSDYAGHHAFSSFVRFFAFDTFVSLSPCFLSEKLDVLSRALLRFFIADNLKEQDGPSGQVKLCYACFKATVQVAWIVHELWDEEKLVK
jgi:hypothetical protein